MRRLIAAMLFAIVTAAPASAHDGLHTRLRRAGAAIAANPDDGDLYLRRAGLHREHGDWDSAFADLDAAGRRRVDADALVIVRADLLLDVGCPRAALVLLEPLVARRPTLAAAHARRGLALERAGRPRAAARVYEEALHHSADPGPEAYFSCARAHEAAGDSRAALAALDAALRDLGPLVAVQERAIALERRVGRFDDALARIDRVLTHVRRPERWLALRADVLDEIGCRDAAVAARREALLAIRTLPSTRRSTPAVLALESTLRAQLFHPPRIPN